MRGPGPTADHAIPVDGRDFPREVPAVNACRASFPAFCAVVQSPQVTPPSHSGSWNRGRGVRLWREWDRAGVAAARRD
ncbi:hypothetical protein GCM10009545_15470 [Saccharopolyspora thermophila]|uniref:Uncharacterized protein n=1 Tax=Saccharopolyspora thermophila TaxID=89367 RepID=A0ABP3M9Q1_9PSEU